MSNSEKPKTLEEAIKQIRIALENVGHALCEAGKEFKRRINEDSQGV